jgi:hypothetical protein
LTSVFITVLPHFSYDLSGTLRPQIEMLVVPPKKAVRFTYPEVYLHVSSHKLGKSYSVSENKLPLKSEKVSFSNVSSKYLNSGNAWYHLGRASTVIGLVYG